MDISGTPSEAGNLGNLGSDSRQFVQNGDSEDTWAGELPLLKELDRSAFSAPDFNIDEYLYQNHRYASLQDLKDQVKQLLEQLDQELIDLVNTDYNDFLELGQSLKGKDKNIEELKVGVLRYDKELKAVRAALIEDARAVSSSLNAEKSLYTLKKLVRLMLLQSDNISEMEFLIGKVSNNSGEEEVIESVSLLEQISQLYVTSEALTTTMVQKSSEQLHINDISTHKVLQTNVAKLRTIRGVLQDRLKATQKLLKPYIANEWAKNGMLTITGALLAIKETAHVQ